MSAERPLVIGLVTVAVSVPTIYVGVPLSPNGERIPYREAVAVALLGTLLSGAAALLFGWLSAVGALVAPAVWIAVIERYCPVDWGVAAIVGAICWAVPTVFTAGYDLLL